MFRGPDSLTISFVLGFGATLADGSSATIPFILETAAKGYLLKFLIAILVTPFIDLGHGIMHRLFGLTPYAPREQLTPCPARPHR